ncbi:putative lipase [Xylogone sp. PMI_703]|nr:putative lipase [Xylogone sp. PMI_703]
MLLVSQGGSVKVGEVVRYTVTYTPANDRILPSPAHLFLKIKNTSAIALRAAFVHGPYTLYVAAYPATFDPNKKFENPRRDGVPEFEPQLKAGGSFTCKLPVPDEVRKTAGSARSSWGAPGGLNEAGEEIKSVSWIIEVASQVIFSASAAVHYEIYIGRDEKSLSLGSGGSILSNGIASAPVLGQVSDHQQNQRGTGPHHHHHGQPKGVYSRSIRLKVEDTGNLWDTPKFPEWDDEQKDVVVPKNTDAYVESASGPNKGDANSADEKPTRQKKQKRVHLVVLTHGLHSNLGADMLYMKESIDIAAKQAKADAKARKAKQRKDLQEGSTDVKQRNDRDSNGENSEEFESGKEGAEDDDDDDYEEVIVRGFSGNATRTEKGIKYLGKRLARYVLNMTYPDQPYRPVLKSTGSAFSHAMRPNVQTSENTGSPSHNNSTIHEDEYHGRKRAYKITSISFIAHSLGGLIQTYAIAYIQKHSPQFFDLIKPINFIALATPFLGLSNENPLYVKFALDFGLVGRTGQDLGLTWRAPTLARSGWGALVNGISENAHKKESSPESKPLLRILPTGPAHAALGKFRNRTVYSNVVNDGIVPLRTSCLLFLDWQGLGRVEKARRENGLIGTVAEWGWGEITGANSSSPRTLTWSDDNLSDREEPGSNTPTRQGHGGDVPQPDPQATRDDEVSSLRRMTQLPPSISGPQESSADSSASHSLPASPSSGSSAMSSFLQFFKPSTSLKPPIPHIPKIYKRSQTIKFSDDSSSNTESSNSEQRKATTGDDEKDDPNRLAAAPPKTTIFESAGDLLKPPIPPVEYLINPSSRPRTIFHDRVYHPEDIPPPPLKKRPTSFLHRRRSASMVDETVPSHRIGHPPSDLSIKDYDDTKYTNPSKEPHEVVDGSSMKVEEKIARAYHRDLSWRKVLVRLEPDAHNNMIVRRMFANAYGWPVVKHLVDTHFSDSAVARMRDEYETNQERAKDMSKAPDTTGDETKGDKTAFTDDESNKRNKARTPSEAHEDRDKLHALTPTPQSSIISRTGKARARSDSMTWSDRDWIDSEADSDDPDSTLATPTAETSKNHESEDKAAGPFGWNWTEAIAGKRATSPKGTNQKEIDAFLGKPIVTSPRPLETPTSAKAEPLSEAHTETKAKDIETVGGEPVLGLGHDGLGTLLPNIGGVAETVAKFIVGDGDDDGDDTNRKNHT